MPTVFCNGKIRTMGESGVVAQLLAGDDGTILAVGSEVGEHPLTTIAQRMDLRGRTILPGPVDAHVHLLWHAHQDLTEADLVGSNTLDDVLGRLTDHARKWPTGWLRGHGFDQERFPNRAFPTRQDLDRVAPDRPAVISRVCEHAVVANSRALEMAGISSDSGLLTEDRAEPLYTVIPEPSSAEWVAIAEHAMQLAVQAGFTGVHCIVSSANEISALQTLHRSGKLPIRVRIQVPYRLLEHVKALGLSTGFGDDWLSIGSIKLFSDGSMGARTAALTTDYSDEPGQTGELIHPQETLVARAREVAQAGCQLAIHAIGDLAVDNTIDAIVKSTPIGLRDARHRIEHASILRPDQIHRLAETGIVCCVQPQFIVTDFWTVQRLGEDRKTWIYPFASMRKAGVHMSGGTDCPVERLSAMESVGRAVTRDAPWRGEDISQGYVASECLSVQEIWEIFSKGGAYCGFREDRFGTLDPGMQCDFIGLREDPFLADPRTLETMQPKLMVTGGKVRLDV